MAAWEIFVAGGGACDVSSRVPLSLPWLLSVLISPFSPNMIMIMIDHVGGACWYASGYGMYRRPKRELPYRAVPHRLEL